MLLNHFRTYELAVALYRLCKEIALPHYLKDQLLRASSSVALNLAEGSAKPSQKDKLRFYHIALGSLRETQAILDLEPIATRSLIKSVDLLGAHLYKLCNP